MKRLFYFFPVQLLLHHIKRNYLFIIFWIILFGFIIEYFGVKYGIPYLFLAPEYIGRINYLSFFVRCVFFNLFLPTSTGLSSLSSLLESNFESANGSLSTNRYSNLSLSVFTSVIPFPLNVFLYNF